MEDIKFKSHISHARLIQMVKLISIFYNTAILV